VPGHDFGFGERQSSLVEEGVRQAVDRIAVLIRPHLAVKRRKTDKTPM
jgi:hypothetical protein